MSFIMDVNDKHDTTTLTAAHSEWHTILFSRLSELVFVREMSQDLDFGGGMAAHAQDVAPIEAKVDEARRMISVLGRELRRRGSIVGA